MLPPLFSQVTLAPKNLHSKEIPGVKEYLDNRSNWYMVRARANVVLLLKAFTITCDCDIFACSDNQATCFARFSQFADFLGIKLAFLYFHVAGLQYIACFTAAR